MSSSEAAMAATDGKIVALGNGLELYVEDIGSGDPIVLIPGWAYSARVFDKNIAALAKTHRVISFDPRSHGRSPKTAGGHTYRTHGDDLNELVKALCLQNITLLGWSLGLYDALSYLDQYGHVKVRALIAVDESPKIEKTSPSDWGEGTADEVRGLIDTVDSDAYLPFFSDYMRHGFLGAAPESKIAEFTDLASSLTPSQAAGLLEDATRYDFRRLLISLDRCMPIMHILREDWSREAIAWISGNQPNAEHHVLGAHLMCMEYPDEFNDLVTSFMSRMNT